MPVPGYGAKSTLNLNRLIWQHSQDREDAMRQLGRGATGPQPGARGGLHCAGGKGGPGLRRRAVAAAMLLGLLLLPGSLATAQTQPLPQPAGEVVLTVSGMIGRDNGGGLARFDLDMLRGLGVIRFATATIWTDGVSTYEGVPLRALLDAVAAGGSLVTATAINDYSATVPLAEVGTAAPILAFLRDGAPMSVRDKGPIWLLYPYDERAAYRTELIYARSVWQLKQLRVHD